MKRWVDYLSSTAKDYLVDWWLGDWLEIGAPGRPKRTPIIQTSTAGYYFSVMAVVRAAVPRFRRPVIGGFVWGAIWLGVGFGLWFDRWEVIGPIVIIAIGVAVLVGRLVPRR